MSGVRRPRGRLFQIRGPTAPKLLSPKLLCVRGTAHMSSEVGDCIKKHLSNLKTHVSVDIPYCMTSSIHLYTPLPVLLFLCTPVHYFLPPPHFFSRQMSTNYINYMAIPDNTGFSNLCQNGTVYLKRISIVFWCKISFTESAVMHGGEC